MLWQLYGMNIHVHVLAEAFNIAILIHCSSMGSKVAIMMEFQGKKLQILYNEIKVLLVD